MNVETSKKILKVFGIIDIITGIIGILVGILALGGGGVLMAAAGAEEEVAVGSAIVVIIGVIILIAGIVGLLEGIFSVRAAKDTSKIMPAWVFAILGVVMQAISVCTSFKSGARAIITGILWLAVSVLIFVAANTIKKNNA